MEFSERLRELRLQMRKMSQEDLQKASGIDRTVIAHYEGGTRKPSFENLRKLALSLNVTSDYLMCISDIPFNPGTNEISEKIGVLSERDRKLILDLIGLMEERRQE